LSQRLSDPAGAFGRSREPHVRHLNSRIFFFSNAPQRSIVAVTLGCLFLPLAADLNRKLLIRRRGPSFDVSIKIIFLENGFEIERLCKHHTLMLHQATPA
jgi:hypothetical protein